MGMQKQIGKPAHARERASADVRKRVLTLSPQLEVVHSARLTDESVDCFDIAARRGSDGRDELLLTDYDNHKLHVLTMGLVR